MNAGLVRSFSQPRNVPNIRELTNYVILEAFYPLVLLLSGSSAYLFTPWGAEDSWLNYILHKEVH